ncbi:MAG: hypothetical protein ACREM8_02075 [Vulcanimicrobiaceae bacterium]
MHSQGGPATGSTALRVAAIGSVALYSRVAYRIRSWGHLPRRRGPTLLIANHQHEAEAMIVVARETIAGGWSPIYTASSRRMYEPGFMAVRTPWLAPLMRRVDASSLFVAIGMLPIENELATRPVVSFAAAVRSIHGDLPLAAVFDDVIVTRLGMAGGRLSQLWSAAKLSAAQTRVRLNSVREPYRGDILRATRTQLDGDSDRIARVVGAGATFFLTPEGEYSRDGGLRTFPGLLRRLQPSATVYLAAIGFDPLRGRRLSMLYRVLPPVDPNDLPKSLAAARPATVSHLLGAWLAGRRGEPFAERFAVDAVQTSLAALPSSIFVDPELAGSPAQTTRAALESCVRLRLLQRTGDAFARTERTTHPQFPLVDDIFAYNAQFLKETRAAVAAIGVRAPAPGPAVTPSNG